MATYNIDTVEHLTIYEAPVQNAYSPARGDTPTALDPVDTLNQTDSTAIPEEDIERAVALAADMEQDAARIKEADDVRAENARIRQLHLTHLVREVGKTNLLEGFINNHENEPENRATASSAFVRYEKNAAETLNRACNVCEHLGNCAIQRNLGDWIAAHPRYDSAPKIPYRSRLHQSVTCAESRMDFLEGVTQNALHHCVPESNKKSKQQAA